MRDFARSFVVVFLGMGLVAATQSAPAATVYSQSPIMGSLPFTSDFGAAVQRADNLTISSSDSVSSVFCWGAFAGAAPASVDFDLRFFNDDGGKPAAAPFATRSLVGVIPSDSGWFSQNMAPVYEFAAPLTTPVALAGNTTYYVSLVENSAGTVWGWNPDGFGSHFLRGSDGAAWSSSGLGSNLAFELYNEPAEAVAHLSNPIPEPASVCALALSSLMLLRRRRTV
jgi:hypothetical protein